MPISYETLVDHLQQLPGTACPHSQKWASQHVTGTDMLETVPRKKAGPDKVAPEYCEVEAMRSDGM